MKIKYEFADGTVSEVEVEESIGAVIIEDRRLEDNLSRKERYHCYSLDSRRAVTNALLNKMAAKYGGEKPKADIQAQAQIPAADTETGRSVDALMERLNLLRH